MNKTLRAAAGIGAICGALAFAGTAEANISLNGGQSGVAPVGQENDVFPTVYGPGPNGDGTYPPNTIPGHYYGDVGGTPSFVTGYLEILGGPFTLTFQYLGTEAGYQNSFQIDPTNTNNWQNLYTTPGGTQTPVSPFTTIGSDTFQTGVIPFRFLSNNAVGAVNGGTAVGSGYGANQSIFVTFLSSVGPFAVPSTATSGSIVDVWYDDSGGNNDDNHDDMGIRITATPVPVPAALPIISAALAGFGFAGWRSKRRAA